VIKDTFLCRPNVPQQSRSGSGWVDRWIARLEITMATKRRYEQITLARGLAGQISAPFGDADLAYLQRAMAEIAPDWAVELEGICAEEATLVVVPDDGDDASGPSFVVSRETYGLRVDQVHWETMTEVGVFVSLSDVVTALQFRLAFCIDMAVPASVTLH
jgi:hypothetical protein